MEKVEEIVKMEVTYKHSFYCDKCGKHLGTTEEQDDGWYDECGEFELRIYLNGWYVLKKHLCDSCIDDFVDEAKTTLINMGFEKEPYWE